MSTYDDRMILNKYSMSIHNKNPNITRAECMRFALNKLRNDKKLREFIHNKSINIKKSNPDMSFAESIRTALDEWKKMKQGSR